MRKSSLLVLLALILALGLAACGGDDDDDGGGGGGGGGGDQAAAEEESTGKVAFIGVAPVTQGNWDPAGYKAFTAAAEKYNFEPTNQESVAYDAAAPVLRRLAGENDMVIAHSSGYEAAVLEVAPEFQDVWFVLFSDLSTTGGNDNVAGWAVNWNEYGYMAGAAGCFAAKEDGGDTVGHVNSVPIPAFTRYAAGEKQGAEEQGCKWVTRWTNSFEDVAKAKQAALSMINDGASVISSSADTADEGSREGAVEGKALYIGNYVAETELAPDNTITSVMINFDQAYDEMGKLFSEDALEAKKFDVDIEGGGLTYEEPFSNVSDKVAQQAADVVEKIKSGEIKVDATAEVKP
jgi:basic membrane protein A and related proteins